MTSFEKKFSAVTRVFNQLAMISVAGMMFLTSADVIMRCFYHSIPGTYEIIGLLSALFVSFSLAHTSMERGHIAVDFVFQRLNLRSRRILEGVNALIGATMFGGITWYAILYAEDLRRVGEVSMTLQLPLYLFVYGIALGCAMLSLTLMISGVGSYMSGSEG